MSEQKKVVELAAITGLKVQDRADNLLPILDHYRAMAATGKFNALAIVAVTPDGEKHTQLAYAQDAKSDSLIVGLDILAMELKRILLED
jgi:hypothetical protein